MSSTKIMRTSLINDLDELVWFVDLENVWIEVFDLLRLLLEN